MEELTDGHSHHKMKRTGIMLAMAIGIHNFPEGMATFISALTARNGTADRHSHSHTQYSGGDSRVGADLPLYGQPAQGFFLFALVRLAELAGALVGMAFLLPLWSPVVNAVCLAVVAGIMVYIAFDELLPGAESFGHHHLSLIGVVVGMALMGITLVIL